MKKVYIYLFLILVLHLVFLNILQFTAWPEMVSFPYFLNHGFINYSDMVHAYPPLLVTILSYLYKIFGLNIWVLKIFGWATFLINDILIFLLLKKFTKNVNLSLFAIFIYAILQPVLEGNMVWPDLFMIPFLLSGILFLENKKYFISGVLFTLAVLTKQTGVFYLGIAGIYVLFERKLKSLISFTFGIMIVIFPFLFSLVKQNALNDFINWTIIYPSRYWTKFPGYVQLNPNLREDLILLILIFSILIVLAKSFKQVKHTKEFYLLFGFLIAGIIGVYPRFSFFHLQPAIAFFVIIIFYLISKTKLDFKYLIIIPILVLLINFRSLIFGGNRFWDNDNVLAQTIQNETPANKSIYLLGLNSDIYTFANRLPNKPWLDNFGWYLEIPGIQDNVIKSFNENKPSVVFWQTPQNGNWYDIGTYQPKMITDWIKENYVYEKNINEGIQEWKIRD